MELKLRVKSKDMVALSKLKPYQEGLKRIAPEEMEKLRRELKNIGLCKTFSVWETEDGYSVLDGHQRLKVLKKMVADGDVTIPAGGIPCELVDCKDEPEATHILISLASQHGRLNKGALAKLLGRAHLTEQQGQKVFSFVELDAEKEAADGKGSASSTKDWKSAKVVECPNCNTYFYTKKHKCEKKIPKKDIWDEQQPSKDK